MSQFPVEDSAGILEGVNYLLSGPAGLGQNFEGFADYEPVFVRPTVRQPFVLPGNTTLDPSFYLNIPINDVVALNSEQIEITFTTPFATAPFQFGDRITLQNVIDTFPTPPANTNFNGTYRVFSCTATEVVLYDPGNSYDWPTYISGGNLLRDFTNERVSTDCNARITIFGPTDRVFISNQLQCDFTYDYTVGGAFDVVLQINRYKGVIDNNASSQDFLFLFDGLVSEQIFSYTADPAKTGTFNSIFTTAIDSPSFGYYWYICEIEFKPLSSDVEPGVFETGLRSLTAQVIKE
jgi:hypothetical protein